MCLDTKDETIKWKWGVGYKVFTELLDGTVSTGHVKGTRQYPTVGQWLADESPKLRVLYTESDSNTYTTGFHLCRTLEGARQLRLKLDWVGIAIRKVKFKHVTTTGKQHSVGCIVARSIMLLPEGE